MHYPYQAAHIVGWLELIAGVAAGVVLFVSLLISGCIRKGDDEDE